MDDFKRFYSNNDVDKSIPYFWETFDPKHYSIWYGEYKYNEELAKVFMSCNLIMGKSSTDIDISISIDFEFGLNVSPPIINTIPSPQILGMYQRLDKMRKNAFASVCLFGEDNNSTISGVWIWRGQELAFPLSPDWQIDYETYDWKKLDPASPETKKLVQDYLSWEGTDKEGRKFNQGKIFK
jgi:elongation factor 1-gamma